MREIRETVYRSRNLHVEGVLRYDGAVYLHIRYLAPWSPSVYKECLYAMVRIKEEFYNLGVQELFILVEERYLKFETMMGFDIQEVYRNKQGKKFLRMSQSTDGN